MSDEVKALLNKAKRVKRRQQIYFKMVILILRLHGLTILYFIPPQHFYFQKDFLFQAIQV